MLTRRRRLRPLDDSEWDDDVREALGDRAGQGPVLNIFRTLAHHPKLLKRWLVFAGHVLRKSALSPRHRELLILRTGWRCRSEYEWGQHVLIGKAVGLGDDEIVRITAGPEAPGWDPLEALLLRAADELHDEQCITDATWDALAGHLDTKQLIDVVFAVGEYTLVSMALNTLGVERDPGVPGFPS